MRTSRLIHSIFLILALSLFTVEVSSAVTFPPSPPSGSATGGTFGLYFQRMVSPCPSGQVVTGFATGTSTYGTIICAVPPAGTETDPEVGSNTANFLSKWNGSALVTSQVYDDGTNVGIGTSTGTYKLEVAGGDIMVNNVRIGRGAGNFISNTIVGTGVLGANTSGQQNTGLGYRALLSNTNGAGNTAVGHTALTSNVGGSQNTALGYLALTANTAGNQNVAIGYQSLSANTGGVNNTVVGATTLTSSRGDSNIALGNFVGSNLTTGSNNILIGNSIYAPAASASYTLNIGNLIYGTGVDGFFSTPSSGNIGIGVVSPNYKLEVAGTGSFYGLRVSSGASAGKVLTSDASGNATWQSAGVTGGQTNYLARWLSATTLGTGSITDDGTNVTTTGDAYINGIRIGRGSGSLLYNLSVGQDVLKNNTTGNQNVGVGNGALMTNTTGYADTANGYLSLSNNTTGYSNTANGFATLYNNTVGYNNTTAGFRGLYNNISGNGNTANGFSALDFNVTGSNNTALGYTAGYNLTSGDNNIFIGYNTQPNISNTSSNQLNIGNWIYGNAGNIGIGVLNPTEKFAVAGTGSFYGIKIGSGASAGKVLTSDASGNGTWQSVAYTETDPVWLAQKSNYATNTGVGASGTWGINISGTAATASAVNFNGGLTTTSSPTFAGLTVSGNETVTGDLTVQGKVITDSIVTRTVTNLSVSGSLVPNSATPLVYRDIGSSSQRWNNLYLSGQVTIGGGSPGVGKVLTSDASGNASWSTAPQPCTPTGTAPSSVCYGGSSLVANTTGDLLTAVGVQSLMSNTTGYYNTAIGYQAMKANTTGGYGVAVGAYALRSNTTGDFNTAVGHESLERITTGSFNTAMGELAMWNTAGAVIGNTAIGDHVLQQTSGNANTGLGSSALVGVTTGANNVGLGYSAGSSLTAGDSNIFIGYNTQPLSTTGSNQLNIGNWIYGTGGNIGIGVLNPTEKFAVAGTGSFYGIKIGSGASAGKVLTSDASGNASWSTPSPCTPTGAGTFNTCLGTSTLQANTVGSYNTSIGYAALSSNTGGSYNNALGYGALTSNAVGNYNNAFGDYALNNNKGDSNSAFGQWALSANTFSANNVAFGVQALYNSTGSNNTAVGTIALQSNTGGSNNTAIGYNANVSNGNLSNVTLVGANTVGSQSNTVILGSSADIGINTSTPGSKLDLRGQFRLGYSGGTSTERLTLPSASTNMWNVDNYNGSLRVFRENFTATGTGPSGAVKLTISDSGAFDVTGTGAFHDPSSYSSYVQIRHSGSWGNGHIDTYGGALGLYLNWFSGNAVNIGNGASGYGTINAAVFNIASDIKLKKNIETIKNPLEKILQLRGVTFQWKNDEHRDIGFIAQEVEKVLPELVHTTAEGVKTVQYPNISAVIIEAIKELANKNNAQDREIETLKKQNLELQKRLDALEAKIK